MFSEKNDNQTCKDRYWRDGNPQVQASFNEKANLEIQSKLNRGQRNG